VDWQEWAQAPFAALNAIQADLRAIREAVLGLPDRFTELRGYIMATEQETRDQLSGAITGALAAYDQVVRERDQYRTQLEQADAEAANRVATALAAEAAEDVQFNQSKVEELRRLQPAVTDPGEGGAPEPTL
jgi:chromosome segregation ATPase